MSDISNYLFFDGNCAEAMRYYERILGGKLEMMTHAQSPVAAEAPPGSADRIMHARLVLKDGMLMASDYLPGQNYPGMHGFSLSLVYPTTADAQKIFDALSAGGKITMPLQKTFWVEAFGMLVDKFGTPWMINGGQPSAAMK